MADALPVVFQRRAVQEIDAIDEWWRTNRPLAPALFAVELERAVYALTLMPTLGARAHNERARDVRRLLLRRTRYHIYYRVRRGALEVLAVWHAVRGTGPRL